ncbi:glycosyltransferase family 2 protein [Flaviaesturariibacter aridisoli]|uniref:Glycosyltransferase family 2 protein n=1 Tax=Flaviaesturariibacter aridisoli TaxID=2545761 RepID=A0A4R4DVK5_9BACT|nr:glycosyltransferase family 2 protein [Flaviaesturariibacter aridisoli]TCZ67350.1 glycosyltransferase family 2 protein [Flaviaesturariibacter aridisoli]
MPAETLPLLSVVLPVFNEQNYIYEVLSRVCRADVPGVTRELVVVDDASTDGTAAEVERFISDHPGYEVRFSRHAQNQGKGGAVQTAIGVARGDFLLIQDADFEYDPSDYPDLVGPLVKGQADVVYGSRFIGSKPHRVLFFYHYMANRFLTTLSNWFTNLNLTDMETGYKAFRIDVLRPLRLYEKRFGFEPEITAKMSRVPRVRIYEVGIAYHGRTYEEGKKINWKDGVKAIWYVLKYNTWARR